jgi:hypothetical protein
MTEDSFVSVAERARRLRKASQFALEFLMYVAFEGKRNRKGNVIRLEFDFSAPAVLYMYKRKGIGWRPATSYRRFPRAAEAICFAVEEFPDLRTLGAWMQVGDQRYDSEEIRRLYESSGYPLRRAPP